MYQILDMSSIVSLSTEWVDYVKEPMKYHAFMHHFRQWVGKVSRVYEALRVRMVGGGAMGCVC